MSKLLDTDNAMHVDDSIDSMDGGDGMNEVSDAKKDSEPNERGQGDDQHGLNATNGKNISIFHTIISPRKFFQEWNLFLAEDQMNEPEPDYLDSDEMDMDNQGQNDANDEQHNENAEHRPEGDEKADNKSTDSLNGPTNAYSPDADNINDCAEMDVNRVNAMVKKSNEPSVAGDGRLGHIGRSVVFDPFIRTRNVPFRIAGRRHSISLFNTIHEEDKN